MKSLCNLDHTHYFNFFQPNQYLAGSKPMSETEKNEAGYDVVAQRIYECIAPV
jgi:hypothetical protein